ncbi:MAG: hypothetical protein IPM42_08900 [Saprospiraceae bacterium]|nr:hypothetical protein [Saprospiraceae bacterium]
MKTFKIFSLLLFISSFAIGQSDSTMTVKIMDSEITESPATYSPVVSVGGRYYFNTLEKTRTLLAQNGFTLAQEAFEYHIQFGHLPKLFYFQQLGDLRAGNYASVTGFGLKKDVSYSIFKNSNLILAPYLEFGIGYYKMNIAKNVTNNSISTVLNSSIENYFLDNFVFSGDAGLMLGFNFNLDKTKVNVILNGGVIGNIPTEWRIAQSLAFREKIELQSLYAGATIRIDLKDCCDKTKCCN